MENSVDNDLREARIGLGRAFLELAAAQRRMRGRDAMQQGELSFAQFTLLQPLYWEDDMPSGALANAAGLTPATTTHMLDQLAGVGIVERKRSTTDRRVVMTSLTQDGRTSFERKRDLLLITWDEALDGISLEDLAIGTHALRRVAFFLNSI
jgi:DNA-binding MarR family transcriptional regulator